jgi:hypothetical protein
MGFMVDKAELGHDFLRVLPFSPVSIIALMLYNHLQPNTNVFRRTSGLKPENLQTNQCCFMCRTALDKNVIHIVSHYICTWYI